MMTQVVLISHSIVYALVVLGFIWISKKVNDWSTPFDDDYLIQEKSNVALGIRRAGLYLAIAIAMAGSLTGTSGAFRHDVFSLVLDGITAVVALFIAKKINDMFILRSMSNNDEVEKDNIAVGLVDAGSLIATGFILNGTLIGTGGGFASVVVFFALGQTALVLSTLIYEAVTSFNILDEIKEGNTSAGILLGSVLVSLGLILKTSIAGPFVSWSHDIISFGISFGVGLGILIVMLKVIDFLLLPDTNIGTEVSRDKNVGALTLTAGALIAMSVIVSIAV